MATTVQEQQLRRFKEMGIPVPLTPIAPEEVQLPVKNKDFAAKLAALKSGRQRDLVETFVAKAEVGNPMNISIPQPKNPKKGQPQQNTPAANAPAVPKVALEAFTPKSLGADLSFLEEDKTVRTQAQKGNPRHLRENVLPDPTGAQFISDFKNRLRDRVEEKAAILEEQEQGSQSMEIPEGYSLINEEELKNKIIQISSQVAKNMMTKVLNEYTASKKTVITESANVKKLEIVGKNVVKIDGKLFNISPVKPN